MASERIEKIKFSGKESLLDIGCGNGAVSALLAGNIPDGSVVGIDSSESMIESAKQRFPVSMYLNLNFCVMDAAHRNFTDKFDVAFSNASLHWIKDQLSVLKGEKKASISQVFSFFKWGATEMPGIYSI